MLAYSYSAGNAHSSNFANLACVSGSTLHQHRKSKAILTRMADELGGWSRPMQRIANISSVKAIRESDCVNLPAHPPKSARSRVAVGEAPLPQRKEIRENLHKPHRQRRAIAFHGAVDAAFGELVVYQAPIAFDKAKLVIEADRAAARDQS